MNPKWSPHAKALLADILHTITYELSEEDAAWWNHRIQAATDQLADFPNIGTAIPLVCYEPVDGEIHVLSIRHARMLIAEGDTDWS